MLRQLGALYASIARSGLRPFSRVVAGRLVGSLIREVRDDGAGGGAQAQAQQGDDGGRRPGVAPQYGSQLAPGFSRSLRSRADPCIETGDGSDRRRRP